MSIRRPSTRSPSARRPLCSSSLVIHGRHPRMVAAVAYGFAFEGVQDAHYIIKGRNRDTAWYRMLDAEWSTFRDRLAGYAATRGWKTT